MASLETVDGRNGVPLYISTSTKGSAESWGPRWCKFTSVRGGVEIEVSSVFLVVKPSEILFIISKTIPQKEDKILPYIGYHSIPK